MATKFYLDVPRFKALRSELGLSQEALANACAEKHLALSIATIKRAELGQPISARTLSNLASFFDVKSDYLARQTEQPKPASQPEQQLSTVLWLSLNNPNLMPEVTVQLKRSGSSFQEPLGSSLIAVFSNTGSRGKGYLQAQAAILELTPRLSEQGFRAMLCLSEVGQDASQIDTKTLQWFTQYRNQLAFNRLHVCKKLFSLCQMFYRYRSLESEQLPLYQLLASQASEQQLPLVGRNSELARVELLLDQAQHRARPVALHLSAMAGMGKSRLLPVIHEQASLRDTLVADVDLEIGWNNAAYSVTSELCQRFLARRQNRISYHSLEGVLARYSSVAYPLIPASMRASLGLSEVAESTLAGPTDEQQLLECICEIFRSQLQAKASSLLISIDNLHLADGLSLALFQQLIGLLQDLPVTLIYTSRSDDSQLSWQQSPEFEGLEHQQMQLQPLTDDEALKIASNYQQQSPDYRNECIKMAEGVPLFLVQLLSREQQNQADLPYSLKLLVESKLAQLAAVDKQVLELLVCCAAPMPMASVNDLLALADYYPEALIKLQFIQIDPVHGAKLSHQLVQQIVYQGMEPAARRGCHLRLAHYIEKHLDTFEGVRVSLLARQFELADQPLKASQYHYLAASELLEQGLYREAQSLLQQTLDKLPIDQSPQADDLEINLQLALSAVYKVQYGWVSPLLKSCYQRIETLCDRGKGDSDRRLSLVLFGLCVIELATVNFEQSLLQAERFLQVSEREGDRQGAMLAYTAKTNLFFWMGDHRQAVNCAEKALSLYQPDDFDASIRLLGQDPRALASCFGSLSASLLGEIEQANALREKMLATAAQLNHDFSTAIAVQGSAWLDFHLQRPEQVLKQGLELDALSIKMGFPFYRGVAALFIGWAKHKLAADQEAAQIVDLGYHQWLASSSDKIAHSLYCIILAEIYIDTQQSPKAVELLDRGISFALENHELCYLGEMYRLLYLADSSSYPEALEQACQSQSSPLLVERVKALALC